LVATDTEPQAQMWDYKGVKERSVMTQTATATVKIKGEALITLRRQLLDAGYRTADVCRVAGFVTIKQDGKKRINFTEYCEEILITRGCMIRVVVHIAEHTQMGVQPTWGDNFITTTKDVRTISKKVREMVKWTNKKCKRTRDGNIITLERDGEIVSYNVA